MSTECPDCGRIYQIGDWPLGCGGDGNHTVHGGTLLSAIHTSERTVILRNPRTGEVRFPPRNDQPIHPKYAAQGYIREELTSAAAVRNFEKTTGRIHERSHYDPGSATAERDLTAHVERAPAPTGLDDPSTSIR